MLTTTDAQLDVYQPGDETPSLSVPKGDISSVSYSERLGHRKDSGRIDLHNHHGDYTDDIQSGARLEFRIDLGVPELGPWGAGEWGDRSWAGERIAWTAMVRDRKLDRQSAQMATLTLSCEDFVFGVMGEREVYGAFDEERIDVILASIIDEHAPELERYVSATLDETVTATYGGQSLLDAVNDLLIETTATARAYRDHVTIRPYIVPETGFELAPSELGFPTVSETDDNLVNDVRVNGARGDALDPGATYEDHSQLRTVHSNRRLMVQIPTRKSEISSVELWTRRSSEDRLTVRIQKDDGGEPVAPNDTGSDLARNQQEYHFISENGWTEFLLPSHTISGGDPWLIVESDGEDGHRVGTNANGELARRVYYPFQIAVNDQDSASVAIYRRREASVSAENASLSESRDIASREVSRHPRPEQTVECTAESQRAHMLRPGEIVELDQPRDDIVGTYLVDERADEYENATLKTTLTLHELRNLI